MGTENGRLISTGSIILDLAFDIPGLPERGGDVLSGAVRREVGGGFNVVASAARHGARVALASPVGAGPAGDAVQDALEAEGIELLLDGEADQDTGTCVVLVEPDGERTFVTAPGAEAHLSESKLAGVQPGPGDVVYVSGYDACYPDSGPVLARWLSGLASGVTVIFDPGPLVAEIPAEVLEPVMDASGVLSLNRREAAILSGVEHGIESDADYLIAALRRIAPSQSVILRDGKSGCWVSLPGAETVRLPAPVVQAVDSTGAGDAHCGGLAACILEGLDIYQAAARANAIAAFSVTRRGSASAPTRVELAGFFVSDG